MSVHKVQHANMLAMSSFFLICSFSTSLVPGVRGLHVRIYFGKSVTYVPEASASPEHVPNGM